ncbi:MAG TPA: copper resistance CopC family protein [Mycolicibacillus parakoreensis]|uniref:Copper resistance protein CopC n=1 Tax=Mycolicibacillus parakoreensis TaxID=1069221 RepID=A0ABY3TZ52_9MYCO|nr:copper resistance CopC family protein [Mycolicibacillus parakoreensis]ULN52979.1 copper resistance protein CopC [Mycolicibacillus parakoreensis]HLR98188.1 copper resistance CopC family protein [Mycolicibacillus parakoreensis]
MTARARAGAAALLLAALLAGAVGLAGAASAHAVLIGTDPDRDAQLTVGPDRVSATFNEKLQTTFAAMNVVGPDGEHLWSTGDVQVDGPVVSIGLRPLGPTGDYTVHYRVTSADGHVVSGSWQFTLTEEGTGTPGPALTSQGPDDGLPAWPFIVGAVVLVGGAAVWSLRRRT